MVPASFEYFRPETLDEAVGLLSTKQDAKVLAGGHSLVPAMKFRLAQPAAVIDISRITDLSYIREANGQVQVGAMTTHHLIESSDLLREKCPLLSETAANIGDVQVRNRGSIGGSLAHADPAADWPAAILALDAELVIKGPNNHQRNIRATDFFVDIMQTALQPNEILAEIRVPVTAKSAAYVKFAQKASGFAIAGVASWIDKATKSVRIGITGIAAKAYRATAVEEALQGRPLTPGAIAEAARKAAQGVDPLNDIHASAAFRAHLAEVNTRRSLELANSR
ncbi:MAG TPA: xanthine dehydrogenase family protein subunit M [Verrucomicrobiae bacterium]|nr:xanthine dehydrogenase family protein subunit M [Verrucomicrobiae bacterium]